MFRALKVQQRWRWAILAIVSFAIGASLSLIQNDVAFILVLGLCGLVFTRNAIVNEPKGSWKDDRNLDGSGSAGDFGGGNGCD